MDMFIDRILEDVLQSFHAMESFLRAMFGSKLVQFIVKVIVHGKGNLEDFQSVSRNMVERRCLSRATPPSRDRECRQERGQMQVSSRP
jgi:hypothetical protein